MIQRQSYRLKAGSLSNLKIQTDNLPDPAEGEVTIAVQAIGLNFADIFAIWGLYSATPAEAFIPGLEYAGVVAKTGKGIQHIKEGDRVMGITRFGAYTTHLNIDHRYVRPLPPDWSFEEGAAYLVQVLTAYYGLVPLGALAKGKTVLIHSAAGGVGIMANRIARKFDAYTIGTVGSTEKLDFLRAENYDDAIVRSKHFREDLVKALDGRSLDLVMECIGGKIFTAGYDLLAPQGRMIIYGSARYASRTERPNYIKMAIQYFSRPRIDPQKMIESNKSLMGFNLIWLYDRVELMRTLLGEIEALQLDKPFVGHQYTFDQLPDAIRTFQSGLTIGKVVIRTNNA